MAILVNKKAKFDYEILETYQAGIELFGHEVKSLRNKKASIEGSHVKVRGGEVYLVGTTISPYQPENVADSYDPERPRRLLLTKKEIRELSQYEDKNGLTIIPLSVYNKGNKLKLEIAVARGKKKIDKRESTKKKDTKREVEREAKHRLR